MTRRPDFPGEMEIDAYLNDQLDLPGRIAVEEALARNPALAARVMDDLRIRDALRAAMDRPPEAPDSRTVLAARRLQRGLSMGHLGRGLRRGALVAACIGLGWLVHWQVDPWASLPPRPPPCRRASRRRRCRRTAPRCCALSWPRSSRRRSSTGTRSCATPPSRCRSFRRTGACWTCRSIPRSPGPASRWCSACPTRPALALSGAYGA
ncbi:anti-sigma factor family protein [Pseudoroseomonas wenyumeiae]